MVISELRSPLAAVRLEAELLVCPDLPESQSLRIARNVLAATMRLEETLSDLTLQLTASTNDDRNEVEQFQSNVVKEYVDT
jgi:hypothetical protein